MPELLLHQKRNNQNRTKWTRTKHSAATSHPPLLRLVFCSSSPFKFRSQVWRYWLPWCMAVVIFIFTLAFPFFFFSRHTSSSLPFIQMKRGYSSSLPSPLTSLKEAAPQLSKPCLWSVPQDGTLEWLRLLAWDSPSTQFSVGRRPENLETESENLEPEKAF